jgi:hypothetical protein
MQLAQMGYVGVCHLGISQWVSEGDAQKTVHTPNLRAKWPLEPSNGPLEVYKYEWLPPSTYNPASPSFIMSAIQEDPGRTQVYLRRIREQESSPRPYVLHFDSEVGDLRPWLW